MSIAFWCLIVAWVWIYLSKGPVVVAMAKLGGYDNHHPRAQQAKLEGWGARALASHQNGFEAFPAFAAAVLTAQVLGGSPEWMDRLAITFVAARILYTGLYVADLSTLRSTVWSVGWFATLGLFLLPLF
jgi:uncharacterized MAPEG superfamily protein